MNLKKWLDIPIFTFALFFWESSCFELVEKGIISSKHLIQYQTNELFCKNLYVCKLFLLHLILYCMMVLDNCIIAGFAWEFCHHLTSAERIIK